MASTKATYVGLIAHCSACNCNSSVDTVMDKWSVVHLGSGCSAGRMGSNKSSCANVVTSILYTFQLLGYMHWLFVFDTLSTDYSMNTKVSLHV